MLPTRRQTLIGAAATAASPVLAAPAPGYVKTFTFVVRKPGMSHADYMDYWLNVHSALSRKVPALKGLVLLEILDRSSTRTDIAQAPNRIALDGVAEVWMEAGAPPSMSPQASPEARAWVNDTPNFVGRTMGYQVEETVFQPVRRGGKGLISLLKRKPGVAHKAFVDHWKGVHGPMASKVPEVEGFILNEVVAEQAPRGDIGPLEGFGQIDGIAQSWHRDRSYPGVTSAQGKAWYADGAELIGEARGFYTQEYVIKEPPTGRAA